MRHQSFRPSAVAQRAAPHMRCCAACRCRCCVTRPSAPRCPKAKELRRVVEPLITLGKDDSEANRRLAFARLRDSEIVAKLFDTIGPRFKARPGGYTRILHMAPRPGDNAPMALMQLVERSAPVAVEAEPEDKKAKKAEAAEGRQGREEGQGRSQEGP